MQEAAIVFLILTRAPKFLAKIKVYWWSNSSNIMSMLSKQFWYWRNLMIVYVGLYAEFSYKCDDKNFVPKFLDFRVANNHLKYSST